MVSVLIARAKSSDVSLSENVLYEMSGYHYLWIASKICETLCIGNPIPVFDKPVLPANFDLKITGNFGKFFFADKYLVT